jgi:hypothetical protein
VDLFLASLGISVPRAVIAVLEQKVAEWKAELAAVAAGHHTLENQRLAQLTALEELQLKVTELQQLSADELLRRGIDVESLTLEHARSEYAAYQSASASLSTRRLTNTIKELTELIPLGALMQNLLTLAQVGQLKELFGDTPIVRV